jgi:hypothetical protein
MGQKVLIELVAITGLALIVSQIDSIKIEKD